VLRGADDVVLPAGEDGPGAAALVRDAESDLFSLGTREAAWAAITDRRPPAGARELDPELAQRVVAAAVGQDAVGQDAVVVGVGADALTVSAPDALLAGAVAERIAVLLHAEGYGVEVAGLRVSFGSR
jgi:coenzyme F420-0:L-glutamate ligase/coenzyme F420-1:gamma-L-glutamate ligase